MQQPVSTLNWNCALQSSHWLAMQLLLVQQLHQGQCNEALLELILHSRQSFLETTGPLKWPRGDKTRH